MRSVQPGKRTSEGLWLLVDDREYFLSFAHFPWFKRAPVGAVLNVKRPAGGHLYWPELDTDVAVESIEHPEKFSLVSRVRPGKKKRARAL